MASFNTYMVVVTLCLSIATIAWAQMSSMMMGLLSDGDMFEGVAAAYWLYNQLQRQIQALQFAVSLGANGGCASGVVGPCNNAHSSQILSFRGRYPTPSSVSLALSDLTTLNPAVHLNCQFRPSSVTTRGATATLTDATNNDVSAHISYMVCPSNGGWQQSD